MSMSKFSEERAWKAYEKARSAAYKIIQSKGATYYGIGTVVSHIVSKILHDSRSVLPLSIPLHGYYDFSGVALSVPCIIGRNGVEETLEIKLDWQEKRRFEKSVTTVKQYL
jgi:L-lactate dehydrogenase